MLKRSLAVALAAITFVSTTAPADAHGRHHFKNHRFHSGGFGFGFGFGPRFYHRPYYAPRRGYIYRRVPAPQGHRVPQQTVPTPAAPIASTPAPIAIAPTPVTPAPVFVPQQQTFAPVPAPVIETTPAQVFSTAPANPTYESVGAYETYSAQFQTAPAPIQAAPVQTFSGSTFPTETLDVVPVYTPPIEVPLSTFQPQNLEPIQTVPTFQ